MLAAALTKNGFSVGQPILAPYGRVKLAEDIGNALAPKLVITLIGERPGGDAIASRSLSAYMAYRVPEAGGDQRYEYSVISNIYSGGLPPADAGAQIAERAREILTYKAAGNRLETHAVGSREQWALRHDGRHLAEGSASLIRSKPN